MKTFNTFAEEMESGLVRVIEGMLEAETIGQKLDRLHPAKCHACGTPYKRTDARWVNGALRNTCKKCGLDQTSVEAGAIVKSKRQH
ncbi:MAG: hypothetical protein LLG20_10295 [Acidobacteriales bacterium]|nr:hypothetical protein [Terriglobales bacterium]